MAERQPEWETELWSNINKSDGIQCPFNSDCDIRQSDQGRLADKAEQLNKILELEDCDPADCDFIHCGQCERIINVVELLAYEYLKKCDVHRPPVPIECVSLAD